MGEELEGRYLLVEGLGVAEAAYPHVLDDRKNKLAVELLCPLDLFWCNLLSLKVITKHVLPTPKPMSTLPPTPPSKTISYTKKNRAGRSVRQQVYSCGRQGHVGMLPLQNQNLLIGCNALPTPDHLTTSGGGTETNNIVSLYADMYS